LSSALVVAKPSPQGEARAAISALSGRGPGAREVALFGRVNGRVTWRSSLVGWSLRSCRCSGAAMARGEFVTVAAAEAGTYREMGTRWLAASGGVRPRRGRDLKGRCVTFAE
jgi:hypothetical protein